MMILVKLQSRLKQRFNSVLTESSNYSLDFQQGLKLGVIERSCRPKGSAWPDTGLTTYGLI